MALNDPLGDLFTRIRNAQMRSKAKISTPGSRLRIANARYQIADGIVHSHAPLLTSSTSRGRE